MPSASPCRQPRAVLFSLALSLLALALLQAWRPFYFLTDDNLCGWMPVVADLGRSIVHGESPFINPHLYGGAHQLLRDPANLCLWHPLVLLLSLLGPTRWAVAMPDIYVSLNLLLCAFAFSHLLLRLREMQEAELSDRRIVLLTLSFTFSAFALIADASWATFSANQATLPILMLGLLHPRRPTGILLVAAATLHSLLGGHLSPLIFSILFASLFVAIYGLSARTWEAAVRLSVGVALALLLAAPLLIPAAQGFVGTARSGALPEAFTAFLRIPLAVLAGSLVGGSVGGSVGAQFLGPHRGDITVIPASLAHIVCSVGALGVFHSCGARRRQSALEWSLLGVAVASAVFIARPPWLSMTLSHIPILRSLRIPMREVLAFGFFLHLWMALRPVALDSRLRWASLAVGGALFAASFWSMGPPSFSDMELDRRLVLSGAASRHWDALRPRLRGRRYVVAIEVSIPLINANLGRVPWSLLGAYNYAALFDVPARAGYAIPGLAPSEPGAEPLNAVMGIYALSAARRLQRRHHEVAIVSLASLQPLRIDWIEGPRRTPIPLPSIDTGTLRPAGE